jgi:hypothetical protein
MKITGAVYLLSHGDGYGHGLNIGCFSTEELAWECARKEHSAFDKDTPVSMMQDYGYWVAEFMLDE